MYSRVVAILFALLLGLSGPAWAESDPRTVIQTFSDQLIAVMKDGPNLGFKGREERLRPAVAAAYDMVAMTKGTLGLAAGKLSADETAQLAEAYTRFSVATYADQFDAWDGERFEVGEARPAANGLMLVPSKIIPASGAPTAIDYLMHQDGGSWKIIDVLFDGSISQVAVRRSEFVPVFRREGLNGLISLLDNKSTALGTK